MSRKKLISDQDFARIYNTSDSVLQVMESTGLTKRQVQNKRYYLLKYTSIPLRKIAKKTLKPSEARVTPKIRGYMADPAFIEKCISVINSSQSRMEAASILGIKLTTLSWIAWQIRLQKKVKLKKFVKSWEDQVDMTSGQNQAYPHATEIWADGPAGSVMIRTVKWELEDLFRVYRFLYQNEYAERKPKKWQDIRPGARWLISIHKPKVWEKIIREELLNRKGA